MILGAGPAGLGAAWKLAQAGWSVTLIERNARVGGLARTLEFGSFKTDIGPHAFIGHNPLIVDFIRSLLADDFYGIEERTHFYLGGKYISFPSGDVRSVLNGFGAATCAEILFDFLTAIVTSVFRKEEPASFEDYVVARFGRRLSDLLLLGFTEKILGLPAAQISPAWAQHRIKGFTFAALVKRFLIKSVGGRDRVMTPLFYAATGMSTLYERMRNDLELDSKASFVLGAYPTQIKHVGDRVTELIFSTPTGNRCVELSELVSSIPLGHMVELLDPAPPTEVREAVRKLRFRSHIALLITLDKPSAMSDLWLYFPEKQIPFGRVSEPRNFSTKMSPEGKTSLLVEFFCTEDDELWTKTERELLGMALGPLHRMGLVHPNNVLGSYMHKERYAYPVYDLGYSENLETVKKYLRGLANLRSIGRAGEFRFMLQHHALQSGFRAAEELIHPGTSKTA